LIEPLPPVIGSAAKKKYTNNKTYTSRGRIPARGVAQAAENIEKIRALLWLLLWIQ
jgi:hypothetical protein